MSDVETPGRAKLDYLRLESVVRFALEIYWPAGFFIFVRRDWPWWITALMVVAVYLLIAYKRKRLGLPPFFPDGVPKKEAYRSLASLRNDELNEIDDLLRQGHKINAIKILREKTGVGLQEAIDFVETYRRVGQKGGA